MKTCRIPAHTCVLVLLAAVSVYDANGAPASKPSGAAPPAVTAEASSYDVGLMLGSQLEHNGLPASLSLDTLIRGLTDAIGGRAITTDERDAAQRFMHDAHDAVVHENRARGREFMERNAKQPGVTTTPSGLQYRVLAAGDPHGKPPASTDQITVRYRASLADGTEIDRSETHDRPASFRVSGVFKGWQEALAAMTPGAKWRLFVPAELGYGSNSPPPVPPGALLIYDLELLRIDPPDAVPMNRPASAGGEAPAGAAARR